MSVKTLMMMLSAQIVVCFLIGCSTQKLECSPGTQRVISYEEDLIPPANITATSENGNLNPDDYLFHRNNVPLRLWCTEPLSKSGARGPNITVRPELSDARKKELSVARTDYDYSNLSVRVSFIRPVLLTHMISSGFSNGYVSKFSISYALSAHNRDNLTQYQPSESNKDFFVSQIDTVLTLEQPIGAQFFQFNIHDGIVAPSGRLCWHLMLIGCKLDQAVTMAAEEPPRQPSTPLLTSTEDIFAEETQTQTATPLQTTMTSLSRAEAVREGLTQQPVVPRASESKQLMVTNTQQPTATSTQQPIASCTQQPTATCKQPPIATCTHHYQPVTTSTVTQQSLGTSTQMQVPVSRQWPEASTSIQEPAVTSTKHLSYSDMVAMTPLPTPSEEVLSIQTRVVKDYQLLVIVIPVAIFTLLLVLCIVVVGVCLCFCCHDDESDEWREQKVDVRTPMAAVNTLSMIENTALLNSKSSSPLFPMHVTEEEGTGNVNVSDHMTNNEVINIDDTLYENCTRIPHQPAKESGFYEPINPINDEDSTSQGTGDSTSQGTGDSMVDNPIYSVPFPSNQRQNQVSVLLSSMSNTNAAQPPSTPLEVDKTVGARAIDMVNNKCYSSSVPTTDSGSAEVDDSEIDSSLESRADMEQEEEEMDIEESLMESLTNKLPYDYETPQ